MLAAVRELEADIAEDRACGFITFVERDEVDCVAAGLLTMESMIPALSASMGYFIQEAIASVREGLEDEA
jgi:hypothetical protein